MLPIRYLATLVMLLACLAVLGLITSFTPKSYSQSLTATVRQPKAKDARLSTPVRRESAETARARLENAYDRLPLSFEANEGQAERRVKFLSRGDGYTLSLSPTEAVLSLRAQDATQHRSDPLARPNTTTRSGMTKQPSAVAASKRATLVMKFAGANPQVVVKGVEELPGRSNYLIGNDAKGWRANIPNFAQVKYESVYPGVDMLYYGDQRRLEYDFLVAPGADPQSIKLDFDGADRIEIDAAGDLVLHTRAGVIRQPKPFSYQEIDGVRREVASGYVLTSQNEVKFELAPYDASLPLVIDPVLIYSTLLDFTSPQNGGVAVDAAGNVYVTGTRSGDIYVAKINAAGTAFVFNTYIGGAQHNGDLGTDIAVDASGNIYVGGDGWSSDLPVVNAFQPTKKSVASNESDGYVFKLNASGSGLAYATYLGGGDRDDLYAIAIDAAGNAYVTGYTESPVTYVNAPSGAPFPTVNAYQPVIAGDNDVFLTKFDPRGGVVYSTYLGGTTEDLGIDVAVDADGSAYLTGVTDSNNFPMKNAYQASRAGNGDLFITKFNPQGLALVFSTYFGGVGEEIGWGIALDSGNNVYLTGYTYSLDFPTANAMQPSNAGGAEAFVTKFNAQGSALVYSTYFGGSLGDEGKDIFVDATGAAHVVGHARSADFPVKKAIRATSAGGAEAIVAKLDPSGTSLVYSTYLGGGERGGIGADYGDGIFVDANGNTYVLGTTRSSNFGPLVNPMLTTHTIGSAFLAKISLAGDETFHRIHGHVGDGNGNSIAGVTVTLSGSQNMTTVTNDAGGYAFNGARPGGNYTVTPSMASRTFTPRSLSFNNLAGDAEANFDVVLNYYNISGKITDGNGTPLAGVAVNITGSQTRTGFVTDSTGTYSFGALPTGGTYTVTPSKTSYTFTPSSKTFTSLLGNQTANFTGTTGAQNSPPSVNLTSPATGSTFAAPANITLSANAADSDGSINRVDFYANGALIGSDSVSPYSVAWSNVATAGDYQLQAVAFDNLGLSNTSGTVAVRVNSSATISGRVTTTDGTGVPGVTLNAGGDTTPAVTDSNGFYTLTVSGAARVLLTPEKEGHHFSPNQAAVEPSQGNRTINFNVAATSVLISEFRQRGPNGDLDDFVELYNNSDVPVTVNAVGSGIDGTNGWAVVHYNNGTPVYLAGIPQGTVIPARGHFLLMNSNSSLLQEGAQSSPVYDVLSADDLPNNSGLALFRSYTAFDATTRLDAVGFVSMTGASIDLFREGTGLATVPNVTATDEQFSYVRKATSRGLPQDTGDNAADFILVSSTGAVAGQPATLGAPGPEGGSSPLTRNREFPSALLDPLQAGSAPPNRVRGLTAVPNGQYGTISIRRTFTNNTGAAVSRLRFRVIDITTLNSSGYVFCSDTNTCQQADVRALSSRDVNVMRTDGSVVPVRGLTLEQPPTQISGGGLNSSLVTGVITTNTPLAPGASVNVQFVLGVQQRGTFRFIVNVEAQP